MAESTTKNESIALYRYLCQNIVGTEEHVKTVRMLNTIRDNLSYDQETATITSGSRGEGIEMKGSDLDIMRTIRYIEVCENTDIRFKHEKTYFIMETEDTKPGFTQLRLVYTNHGTPVNIFEQCEEIGDECYFSNFKFKRKFTGCVWSTVHGPCLNDESGQYDIAYYLRCKSWITQAKHWIRRPNNSWPEDDVKQAIIKHGILFVPIGDKGSIKEDLEWRISFSVAEKFLIYTFTHTQLLCYALMKIILKDVINKKEFLSEENIRENSPDLLCSYFLKTIVFWVSEELPPSIWKTSTIEVNIDLADINKMAESATVNESLALYGYICQNIVGTEEHVKYFRMMNSMRDNLTCDQCWTTITSGSFGEGLDLKDSVVDIMSIMNCFEVVEELNIIFKPNMTYFTMATEATKTGYPQFYKRNQYSVAITILQYSLLKCSPDKLCLGSRLTSSKED
ncbi:uncharacterized protein LOC134697879 [Mytilus trossulus]|uniref:uncharacterized protein LOC134697879 n=1 Tax=Mytilus trossulus TaxID=6551 RepID=UPI00300613F6